MKKRIYAVMLLVVALALLSGFPVGAEETVAEAAENTSFYDPGVMKVWFEEKVLPNLTSTLLIIGVGLVELIPAIRSLLKARGAFQKAADDVGAYTEAKIEYDVRAEEREKKFLERLEEYDRRMEMERERTREALEHFEEIAGSYAEMLRASEARLGDSLHHVERAADKTERMIYVGMVNSCELVKNGAARRIAEIEEEEDANEDGTE